ncbi:MAG: radical SAM family heme chaperone HemW [Actinomycetota bacterium]|nr:radical SAM family heme chaperone HemW [Actinomycetota bacterium]
MTLLDLDRDPSPRSERGWTGSGAWMADPGFGVYVHIPFCRHRCNYCDFNTYEGQDGLHDLYVEALVGEIERWEGVAPPATSVFFGGGTPTLLPPRALGRVLDSIRNRFAIVKGAEVTVEANPETVDEPTFAALLEGGFNRVSIGVQSLAESVLRPLGRTHSAQRALDAIGAARRAGVRSVNADLIYGSPWENEADWEHTLHGVLAESPDHVSAYALTVEEGTPLATLVATGRAPEVDPDVQSARHELAERLLSHAGLERYEISNWARAGAASRHNVLYWSAGNYAAFGAGAHGHLEGRRWWSVKLPRDFIDAVTSGRSAEAGHELLDERARAAEALVLGLRLRSGVDLSGFAARFGGGYLDSVRPVLLELGEWGLVEYDSDYLSLTPRGTMLANEVAYRLL